MSGTNYLNLAEVQVFGVSGSTTTYAYSGNTVTATDPAGRSKTFTMDAFGNLKQVQDASDTTTYTYDMLNHLTGVSMPRSGYTQTRTFNYNPNSTTVGVDLLSATNPENGTVIYTYNSDHTLATKTDAKGQVFTFSYDGYKRLTTVSVGGTTLRTYSYDSNPFDAGYSQSSAGRLTAIQYNQAINYNLNPGTGSTSFIDMFSYSQPGQLTGKRLRVTKTTQYLSQTQTATGDLNLTYSYNAEGKMVSMGYPTGPSYTYSFDNMMRPSGMTDQSNIAVVNNVQYGPANELLSMNMPSAGTETRTYNSMLQLTGISGMGQNVTYTFPSATNNGKIVSQTDNISGETVTYQYDSLNRLIQASGSGWSQSQSYDGFGNLTNRTGSMPMSTPVDPATNRLSMAGVNYDANGNMTSNGYYGYDAENRLAQINGGQTQYAYDAQNKRIWQGSFSNNGDWYLTSDTVSLFGIDGKLIGTYTPQQSQTTLTFAVVTQRVYFGSKLIGTVDSSGSLSAMVQDRLGSRGKYYPYGEERNSPQLQNDQVKFATYTRDSATGLDYADQRYYASTFGRFMTTDPTRASVFLSRPHSWNRYSYVEGDPANSNDPTGRYPDPGAYCSLFPEDPDCQDDCGPIITAANGVCDPGPDPGPGPPKPRRVPTALRIVNDCWYPSGQFTSGYERVITYQVVDQFGDPFLGNGLITSTVGTVSENVTTISGPTITSQNTAGGQPWALSPSGAFVDYLAGSKGGVSIFFQSFVANTPDGGVALAVIINGFAQPTLLNSATALPTTVTSNGTATSFPFGVVFLNATISPRPCTAKDPPP